MTDNDYIAEYVKEKRPEVIRGRDFFKWKLSRFAADAAMEISKLFAEFVNEDIYEDISEAAGDEEEKTDDWDKDKAKQGYQLQS